MPAAELKGWERHVVNNTTAAPLASWCGVELYSHVWYYTSIDHAARSAPRDRLQPCPACVAAIVAALGGGS